MRSISRGVLSLLLLIVAHAADAQDVVPTYTLLSAGPSLATGTAGALVGVHLAFAIESGAPESIKLRIEGLVIASGAATAQPSCVAGSLCESYSDPYTSLLYSGSLVLVTPHGQSGFYGLAGGGVYHGAGNRSTQGDKFGTTGGASAGLGFSPGSGSLSFELRYHYLFRGLGRQRGLVVPSVSIRF